MENSLDSIWHDMPIQFPTPPLISYHCVKYLSPQIQIQRVGSILFLFLSF